MSNSEANEGETAGTKIPLTRVSVCFASVPDLREYSVQVGLRHLNQSSLHPRLHISRLICGPEGSNLVMLKLVQ